MTAFPVPPIRAANSDWLIFNLVALKVEVVWRAAEQFGGRALICYATGVVSSRPMVVVVSV